MQAIHRLAVHLPQPLLLLTLQNARKRQGTASSCQVVNFSCVCPEPVWANARFCSIKRHHRREDRHAFPPAHRLQPALEQVLVHRIAHPAKRYQALPCAETVASFGFALPLCLSRACLGQMIAFLGNVDEEEEKDATFPLTCELPRGTINVDRPEAIVRVHSCSAKNATF